MDLSLDLERLARAYELRQSGLCWKRVAREVGGDARLLCAQVSHLVRHGIRKGADGYARQRGRRAAYPLDTVRRAARLRAEGYPWAVIAPSLSADVDKLRRACWYAKRAGLL